MSPKEVRARTIRVLRAHRADPVRFVREALEAEPTEQQAALLRAASKPGAHVAVRSGHGTGKSTSMAWLLLWFLCTHPDARVPATAPTGHQLEDILWPEVAKWHGKLHPYYRDALEVNADKIALKGASSFAVKRTARKENPEALQGFHGRNLLFLIDEASGIPEQIFEVAEGALSTPNARVVMAANPTQTSGYFWRAFHGDRDRWTRLRFSSADSPLVSKEYVETMAKTYGEESDIFRVRVLGEFPSASVSQLIPADLVDEAMAREPIDDSVYRHAPVVLGVDVARYGDDKSVIVRRQGLVSSILWTGRGVDTMALADIVAHHWTGQKAQACFIDEGAMGAGVVDRLRQLGLAPVAVNFGAAASNPAKYRNKRAEMWCLMRDWLKSGGFLPLDNDLRDDLVGPEYQFLPSGAIQLERKEDMRRRGVASPDLADALAVTFAYPVSFAPGLAPLGRGETQRAKMPKRTIRR